MVALVAGPESTDEQAQQEQAPRRRGRPPGSTNKPRDPNAPRRGRRPSKRDLTDEIAMLLELGNGMLFGGEMLPGMRIPGVVPEQYVREGDPLQSYEIKALAKAINGVAQTNVVFYRYLNMILTGTGGGSPYIALVIVSAAIAVPRLVARNLIPPFASALALGAGKFLAGMEPPQVAPILPTV